MEIIKVKPELTLHTRLEYIMLMSVAVIGLVGSIYIFNTNTSHNFNNNYSQFSTSTVANTDEEVGSFNSYFEVDGKKRVGEDLKFTAKFDIKAKRYVMEMGDGMRMIITQPEFTYSYKEAGKYLLELKTIERGLISTVATKNLKVK